ncbi:hypothetical protein GQ55_9G448400 [Panicum hallii var. hallii]|uniref:Uncharacterized protein n=1 Tax=Panicum hallii var. hallii TaxID=1504633 RepID=A0A2T7CBN5_9POAL|nr:hypothetical protein GQ55_9G448400 [Panicum hallii var. hallii]
MRNHKLAPTTPSSSSKNNKVEQPHLSGAYIRSLVKQLSSSSAARSKDHSTMGAKPHAQPQQEDQQQAQTAPPQQQQQQPHKKQVRRRLHTSRPYQERLLNMAEARREIVTALKIHRASMRQAKEQQQQQQQLMQLQLQQQQEVHLVQEQSQAATRASAPMSYASYSDYLYNSPFSHFSSPSSYSSPLTYQQTPAPMVNSEHNLDHLVPLPAQPLGLNLSFQGFNSFVGDDTNNSACSFDPPLLQPSPTSSYSVYSSPSVTMASHDLSAVTMENTSLAADASLHRVLDDEEMAAIYLIGEQHDIEWSDTVNLVTSAWWSKLLESIEDKGNGAPGQEVGGAANTTEDSLVHMPGWYEANEQSSSDVPGMHLNDYYHHNVDVSLPGMEIGEIEGWNAEWFS